MNIYLVVEGPVGEKRVYAHWVPLVNPRLRVVSYLDMVVDDHLLIVSGGGYPNYWEVIKRGILDVMGNAHIDRLVIAVDSEDMSYDDKYQEIDKYVRSFRVELDYKIIVQHFCLETWALGNQALVARRPKDPKLREYREMFDVLVSDPELLPNYSNESLNRSQFAARYLKKLLNEKHKKLTYSKSNPIALLHDKFYDRVKTRLKTTGHIRSFDNFLTAFI
jgi:soluble cytochrome b562